MDDVAYDASSGQILVDADLGSGKPRRFIFDTGAYENYLWSEEAEALGWKPEGEVVRHDASTSPFVVRHVHGKRVAIGKAVVNGQSFATRPRGMRHADGLLGYPVIRRFVIDVDFVAHRLRFWTPSCDRATEPGSVAVPLRFLGGGRMPVVDAILLMPRGEPLPATWMVDTGAGAAALLNTPFVARHDVIARATAVADEQTGSIGGGQSTLAATRARELRLGGFTLARPIVLLGRGGEGPDAAGSFGSEHPRDGILGCAVFGRFHFTIDYPHHRLLLRPNERFAEPFRHDSVQALLAETPGGLRVVALRPGGGADRAGLRPDDVIVAIAGAPPGVLTKKTFWSFIDRGGAHALDVRRGAERRRLTLTANDLP